MGGEGRPEGPYVINETKGEARGEHNNGEGERDIFRILGGQQGDRREGQAYREKHKQERVHQEKQGR